MTLTNIAAFAAGLLIGMLIWRRPAKRVEAV